MTIQLIPSVASNKITVTSNVPFSKRYLKYLTKKFLKKNTLRDWIRVVASSKDVYQLRFYNIASVSIVFIIVCCLFTVMNPQPRWRGRRRGVILQSAYDDVFYSTLSGNRNRFNRSQRVCFLTTSLATQYLSVNWYACPNHLTIIFVLVDCSISVSSFVLPNAAIASLCHSTCDSVRGFPRNCCAKILLSSVRKILTAVLALRVRRYLTFRSTIAVSDTSYGPSPSANACTAFQNKDGP